MWAILLFSTTFVLQLIFLVLVESLHADLWEDLGSWTHVNAALTRKLVWPLLIISTLISTHTI